MKYIALCLSLGIVATTGLLLRAALPSSTKCETPASNQSVAADPIGTSDQPGEPIELLQLENRDRIITVKSGRQGRLYTVQTPDGEVVLADVSAEQLRAALPEVFDGLDSLWADCRPDPRYTEQLLIGRTNDSP